MSQSNPQEAKKMTLSQITKQREDFEKAFKEKLSGLKDAYSQLNDGLFVMVAESLVSATGGTTFDGRTEASKGLETLKAQAYALYQAITTALQATENTQAVQQTLYANQLRIANLLEQITFVGRHADQINEKFQTDAKAAVGKYYTDLETHTAAFTAELTAQKDKPRNLNSWNPAKGIIPAVEFPIAVSQIDRFRGDCIVKWKNSKDDVDGKLALYCQQAAEQFSRCYDYVKKVDSNRKKLADLAAQYVLLVAEMEKQLQILKDVKAKTPLTPAERTKFREQLILLVKKQAELIGDLSELGAKLDKQDSSALPAVSLAPAATQESFVSIQQMLLAAREKFLQAYASLKITAAEKNLLDCLDVMSSSKAESITGLEQLPVPLYKDEGETEQWKWGGMPQSQKAVVQKVGKEPTTNRKESETPKEEQKITRKPSAVRRDSFINFQFASLERYVQGGHSHAESTGGDAKSLGDPAFSQSTSTAGAEFNQQVERFRSLTAPPSRPRTAHSRSQSDGNLPGVESKTPAPVRKQSSEPETETVSEEELYAGDGRNRGSTVGQGSQTIIPKTVPIRPASQSLDLSSLDFFGGGENEDKKHVVQAGTPKGNQFAKLLTNGSSTEGSPKNGRRSSAGSSDSNASGQSTPAVTPPPLMSSTLKPSVNAAPGQHSGALYTASSSNQQSSVVGNQSPVVTPVNSYGGGQVNTSSMPLGMPSADYQAPTTTVADVLSSVPSPAGEQADDPSQERVQIL
jgi:hypothetical protein